MVSAFFLALLLGGSATGYFYFQLGKRTANRSSQNFIGAALGGLFVFIIVWAVSARFF